MNWCRGLAGVLAIAAAIGAGRLHAAEPLSSDYFPSWNSPSGQGANGPGYAPGQAAFAGPDGPQGYPGVPNPYQSGYPGPMPPAAGPPCPYAPPYPYPGMTPPPGYGPDSGAANAPAEYLPRWTIELGAITLHPVRPPSRTLATDFLNPANTLDARDAAESWGYGPRIDAIGRYDSEWSIELLYYGIGDWSKFASVSGLGFNVPILSPNPEFIPPDVSATARMDIYNAEFNVRRKLTENITGLMGFRFLEVLDELSLVGSVPELLSASMTTKVNNALYGFQVGADARLFRGLGPLYLDVLVKGGVYDNFVTRTSVQSGIFGNSTATANLDHVAFVGEVAFLPTWDIFPHCSVYGGYEALFVQGVAVSGQEIGSTGPIHASRTTFYQGAVAGLTVYW